MDKTTSIADRLDALADGMAQAHRTGFTLSPLILRELARELRSMVCCDACPHAHQKEKSSNAASPP